MTCNYLEVFAPEPVSAYGSVSIWCKRFNENFGAAYFKK
ncbi:hypothetical protein COD09_21560 [Bacillus cereus]|uniref:DM13 domain-containing protein n=1 Tax=Bacillus cereus TaxID=1396 RepID=A0A2C1D8L3_BACCE|nr:hypothetical protein COD09_21560 [Bacillus cereus]